MACGLRRCRGKRGCMCPGPRVASSNLEMTVATTVSSSSEHPATCVPHELEKIPSHIVKIFQRFDVDGNGRIDRDELTEVLQKCNRKFFTVRRIRELFRAADLNRDHVIDWNEFLRWVFQSGPDQEAVREAGTTLEALEAQAAQHEATLAAAEAVSTLTAALDEARPFLSVDRLKHHEDRLHLLQSPFTVLVSTISGLECKVDVTRGQLVSVLTEEVARHFGKKAYQIKLAHSGGRLHPSGARLEDCGVIGPEVQLCATFSQADTLHDSLRDCTFADYLDQVVTNGIATKDSIDKLQGAVEDGSMTEDECRRRFDGKLLEHMSADVRRKVGFQALTLEELKAQAVSYRLIEEGDDIPERWREQLVELCAAMSKFVELREQEKVCNDKLMGSNMMLEDAQRDIWYTDGVKFLQETEEQIAADLAKVKVADLQSLLKLRKPPENYLNVLRALCILLQLDDRHDSLVALTKRYKNGSQLLQALKNVLVEEHDEYDGATICDLPVKLLWPMYNLAADTSFHPEHVTSSNACIVSLSSWIYHTSQYLRVARDVGFKREVCRKIKDEAEEASMAAQLKQTELSHFKKELNILLDRTSKLMPCRRRL